MKAIRKTDGKEIDVVLVNEAKYLAENPDTGSKRVYNESALTLKEAVDWNAFRREAAKDAMSGMLADADFWEDIWTNNRYNGRCDYPSEIAKFAIACADELIKQIKDGKD